MEPEKKDVWGLFDDKFKEMFTVKVAGEITFEEIKSFIKTHFIPRAEVEAKYENCPQCTGLREEFRAKVVEKVKEKKEWYSGGGNEPIRKVLDDVLDLIKTINNE